MRKSLSSFQVPVGFYVTCSKCTSYNTVCPRPGIEDKKRVGYMPSAHMMLTVHWGRSCYFSCSLFSFFLSMKLKHARRTGQEKLEVNSTCCTPSGPSLIKRYGPAERSRDPWRNTSSLLETKFKLQHGPPLAGQARHLYRQRKT